MNDMNKSTGNRPMIELPEYETPAIVTFTDEELLEELGPAQALVSGASGTGFGS
jgi:hypothetical protein